MKSRRGFLRALGVGVVSIMATLGGIKRVFSGSKGSGLPFTIFRKGDIVSGTITDVTDASKAVFKYYGVFVKWDSGENNYWILWGGHVYPLPVDTAYVEKVDLSAMTTKERSRLLSDLEVERKIVAEMDEFGENLLSKDNRVVVGGGLGIFLKVSSNPSFTVKMAEVKFDEINKYKGFIGIVPFKDVRFVNVVVPQRV